MTWLHLLLSIWVICAAPVTALVVLCFDGAVTMKDKIFFLVFGVIAVLLSPVAMIWLVLELAGDVIGWLRRRL